MNFFKNIQNSIYSPTFYKTVPKKTFWQSINYFLLLILTLTILNLITFIPSLLIETPTLLQNLVKDTLNCFPDDLEIKITKGEVSTNVEQPYFISSTSCTSFAEVADLADTPFSFAVIDTKTPFSQSKFEEYNSIAWLTKDTLVLKDRTITTRLYNLTKVKDFKLTKQTLAALNNQFSPYFKFVGPLLLSAGFLVVLLMYLFRLSQLLLTASLIWLLGKVFKNPLNYSSSYKIGLYAATLGLITELLVNSTSRWTNFYGFPFMFTAITLGVVIINVFTSNAKAEKQTKDQR